MFCDRDFFLLRAPVLRSGMPCLKLSDCHVAALLAMTPKRGVFVWKTDAFLFMRSFFARCCSAPFFKRFVPEIVPFPRKPTRFVIARRARAPDAAIFNETICHPVTNYG